MLVRYLVEIYAAEPDLSVLLAETEKYAQYTVPTAMHLAHPETRSARIAANRMGRRDETLRAIDVSRMNGPAKRILKAVLVNTGRYERALERLPNLQGLDDVELGPGSLDDFRAAFPEQFESWDRLFPNDPTR